MNLLLILPLLVFCTAYADVTCENGGTYNEQFEKCYKFVDIPLGRDDALQVCTGMGSTLVSIKNAFEQQFVYTQAKMYLQGEQFWTGGNDYTTLGVWKWTDSSSLFYVNWKDGYPTDDASAQCVAVEPTKGKWFNTDCATSAKFVCEQNKQAVTTLVPPTTSPWIYFADTNSYYKVFSMNDTWNGYERRCAEEGGNLSTVFSMRENDFLNTFISYAPKCWYMALGLRAAPPGQLHFFWIDGSPMNFTNWKPGLNIDYNSPSADIVLPKDQSMQQVDEVTTTKDPWADEYYGGFINFYDGKWDYFRCTMYFSLFCGVCKRPAA